MKTSARPRILYASSVISAFVVAATFSGLSHAAPIAIGTVDSFDSSSATAVVLGQRLNIGSATLIAGTKSYSAAKGVRLLTPGAVVWVDGEFKQNGTARVSSLTVLPDLNVPGATQVFVAGVVKAVDRTGKVTIGSLKVDMTPALATAHVGDFVEVLGTQPAAGGVLVASAVAPLRAQGVGGTGLNGVGGTGLNGVGGTGLNGVGGTGLNGVGGTGLNGVGGTGLNGVGGTGLNGVGGTGLNGVGGTGLNGVGGTGLTTKGVGGTGLNGVGGTGLNGVGGTGLNGVGGTGK
jgi:hypothetical protein